VKTTPYMRMVYIFDVYLVVYCGRRNEILKIEAVIKITQI